MDATADWYWEGNVVDSVCRHLTDTGWLIESRANTLLKERGVDIVAVRGDARLLIEVKGYPPSVYRDPRRAGEKKRTNPSVQAKHWLAEAVLGAMRLQSRTADVSVAIALPNFPRYRALLAELRSALEKLEIMVLVVDEDGMVRKEQDL